MGGAGFLLMFFIHDLSYQEIFCNGTLPILYQCIAGSIFAGVASLILVLLLQSKYISPAKHFFVRIIQNFNLTIIDILFISFCAGAGEELFFRGAIQPWLGIWLTSLVFILLHGYLHPKNKSLFIYGIVLCIISAGFGYLMEYAGLYAAITAHFFIDVVLLLALKSGSAVSEKEF
jgi:hypothetical protein